MRSIILDKEKTKKFVYKRHFFKKVPITEIEKGDIIIILDDPNKFLKREDAIDSMDILFRVLENDKEKNTIKVD